MLHHRSIGAAVAAIAAAAIILGNARAQTVAPAPETPYAVSYIEVASKDAGAARKLLRGYRDASRKAPGLVQLDVFQRIGHANHFAIVEQWSGAKARADNAGSSGGKAYRAAIASMLITAYDERPHYSLSTGAPVPAARSGVYVVTHVDIIPPRKDDGVASVKALADKSRGTPGNLRFDALTQANRPNHMTLVESWRTASAQDAHTTAAHTRSFRHTLLPMTGSLYDERLYRLLP